MRQFPEQVQAAAAEVHHIHMKLIRRIGKHRRYNQGMDQRSLAAAGGAVDSDVSLLGKVQIEGILGLGPWIVQQSHSGPQAGFRLAPTLSVKAHLRQIPQEQFLRQLTGPDGLGPLRSAFAAVVIQIFHHCLDLAFFRSIAGGLVRLIRHPLPVKIHYGHLGGPLHGQIPAGIIGCAAPEGLDLLKDLILTYLHKRAARVCDLRRVGMVKHIPAVCRVGHLQAPAEAGVGIHFVVHNAGGLLGQQDHVDAQRAADGKHAVHRLHKIREAEFELRELVDHDKQIGQRLLRLPLVIEFEIAGDVADLIPIQQRLPPGQFIFQSDEVAADAGVQIRHRSRQMGQIPEGQQQAGSLEVNEHKGHGTGREIHRHR